MKEVDNYVKEDLKLLFRMYHNSRELKHIQGGGDDFIWIPSDIADERLLEKGLVKRIRETEKR